MASAAPLKTNSQSNNTGVLSVVNNGAGVGLNESPTREAINNSGAMKTLSNGVSVPNAPPPSQISAPVQANDEKAKRQPQKRGGGGRWSNKRKFPLSGGQDGSDVPVKRQKSDLSNPPLPPSGFPVEFPYNKDGYRYILAHVDPHAPFRKDFEESQECAGKPIPGFLCRKYMSQTIGIAPHDRAPQLKLSEDRQALTGEKGYCMGRCNFGVNRGTWYFEAHIVDQPEQSACRIGWGQELANLQAPLGYDKFGYSWRSKRGTKFHESRGEHFADSGYEPGDVVGILIHLPESISCTRLGEPKKDDAVYEGISDYLPLTYKDRPLVRFKSFLYFEEKDEIQKALKSLKVLPGSKIVCFKNGENVGTMFENLYAGTYYPAVSLYKGITVRCNFGPEFKHPPSDEEFPGWRPMKDAEVQGCIDQSMADLMYLVENEAAK